MPPGKAFLALFDMRLTNLCSFPSGDWGGYTNSYILGQNVIFPHKMTVDPMHGYIALDQLSSSKILGLFLKNQDQL